ncbi:MAG: asparagine synthase-related protein, partial [Ginsengibacter sp.]
MTNGLVQINNIKTVDPACYIEYDIKSKKITIIKYYVKKYFTADIPGNHEAFHLYKLRKVLTQSVYHRLNADVPVGVYLSGGLDSSIIGAIAAKKIKKLNTFSIGFISDPNYDESQIARKTAQFISSEHRELLLSNDDLIE